MAGLALVEAGLKRRTALGTATRTVGANLPDVAALAYLVGGGVDALTFRRAWTHGVLAMLVVPVLLAACVVAWDRLTRRRRGEHDRAPIHVGLPLARRRAHRVAPAAALVAPGPRRDLRWMERPSWVALTTVLLLILACGRPEERALTPAAGRAIADSVATLFDSLVAIHQVRADTALLSRLYPGADTLLYVEALEVRAITGDSLVRRTLHSHATVAAMAPRALERRVQLLDWDNAVLNAIWEVDVVDTAGGHHPWRGPITLVATRRGERWVIRAHRE